MGASATSLPPLPADMASGDAAGVVPAGSRPGPPTGAALAGGVPAPIQALMQIEDGVQKLVQSLPSVAPVGAAIISQLRQIVPQSMMQSQNAGAPQPGAGMTPPPQGPPPQ